MNREVFMKQLTIRKVSSELAMALGVLPLKDHLEGIGTDIGLASILNVQKAP